MYRILHHLLYISRVDLLHPLATEYVSKQYRKRNQSIKQDANEQDSNVDTYQRSFHRHLLFGNSKMDADLLARHLQIPSNQTPYEHLKFFQRIQNQLSALTLIILADTTYLEP